MKIGFIDYYLDEWHANNYPAWIREASGGQMEVALAYGMIDSPIGGRTNEQWCREMNIPRALTIEEVVEQCDGVIVLSPDNCEMHEQLCQIPLRSGKPVYIDKTFAPDYETARRIFDLAEAHSTPCYSTSALRFADEYENPGPVDAIASWGPNGFETYAIHQLEPIMMLIQAQPSRVLYVPGRDSYTMTIAFDDGRVATLTGFDAGSPFMMNVSSSGGSRIITVESDFFHHFIEHLVAFFRDPTRIVPHGDTLRIMAVRGAGLKAMQTPGSWVEI